MHHSHTPPSPVTIHSPFRGDYIRLYRHNTNVHEWRTGHNSAIEWHGSNKGNALVSAVACNLLHVAETLRLLVRSLGFIWHSPGRRHNHRRQTSFSGQFLES